MSGKQRIVCGLDVGSSKTCAIVARVAGPDRLEWIGSGYSSSRGLAKGIIVNLEDAVASIRKVAEELEAEFGLTLDWVAAGISGNHIQSDYLRGAIAIKGKHYEVTAEDKNQVIHVALSTSSQSEREVLHAFPLEFFLDAQKGIQNPVGMTGAQLFVNVHVVTGDSALIQNLINAVNKVQARVKRVACLPIASGEAVLTPDERELGTAVIDIGAGTTGIALFLNNSIAFTSVIPAGGAHFTRDLVEGINTPSDEAERVKKEFGNVLADQISAEELITIRRFGTRGMRDVRREEACKILRVRAEELLHLVKGEIARSSLRDQLVAGAVLTGGGSLLGGILELAGEILEMPVRLGMPHGLVGLTDDLAHPCYAGAVGLALLDAQYFNRGKKLNPLSPLPPSLLDRILSWLGD